MRRSASAEVSPWPAIARWSATWVSSWMSSLRMFGRSKLRGALKLIRIRPSSGKATPEA
jgi:hypothetical protein